jgi:hypothetical protein
LNILITNRALAGRSGTEVVVRDLSLGLKDRGHHPRVYSPVLGPMAEEIRGHGIAVCKVSVATYLSAGCRKLVTFTEVSALMVQSRP